MEVYHVDGNMLCRERTEEWKCHYGNYPYQGDAGSRNSISNSKWPEDLDLGLSSESS